jgi:hypothetical protein
LTHTTAGSVDVTFVGKRGDRKNCVLFTSSCIVGDSSLAPPPEEASSLLPFGYEYADPDLFSPSRRPIEVLIGNNLRNLFVRLNRDKKLGEGLILKPTFFGWIPSGRAVSKTITVTCVTNTLASLAVTEAKNEPSSKLEFLRSPEITFLWELEVLGIRNKELESIDNVIIEQFRRTTRFENGRYVVCWPRKTDNLNLPTHYRMCVARLKNQLRTMDRETLARYDETIREQLTAGVIEKAPRESRHNVHYMPHKAVLREGKLRIVYDASAKLKSGQSLNDLLYAGPSLTGNLVAMLLNFRLHPIALLADIEKAFLNILLDLADRDLVRFLWVEDINCSPENAVIVIYRFTRTPFGVVSSPFLLNMVLQELLAGNDNEAFRLARNHIYVDNLVLSVSNLAQAAHIYENVTDRLATASFNLRDWTSNSDDFVNSLPPEKRMQKEGIISVLGLEWSRKEDKMQIRFKEEQMLPFATLRSALSALGAVFDPLGLCSPCLLDLKLFIQQCWKIKVDWDKPVPSLMESQFRKLMLEREEIKTIKVPRYLWNTPFSDKGSYELHTFCDSSKLAYGCAIFLVHKYEGTNEVQLIYAKVRVAPLQERTIPQLELLAVATGKRSTNYVRNSLDISISRTFIWTDATTVIQWLHSATIQPQFVQNRLNEIRSAVNVVIRYTPTRDNPADILSRGQKASALRENDLWWHGPTWLLYERLWPPAPAFAGEFSTHATQVVTLLSRHTKVSIPFLTDTFERHYSCWNTCVRKILRLPFLARWYEKLGLTPTQSFARAELVLIRLIQQKYFSIELEHLRSETKIHSDLELFLHTDGIIRCRDRYETAPLDWDLAHPIYLPRESPLVRTLIYTVHRLSCHPGTEITLLKIRERFWLTKARSLVNSVIHRCNLCRRWRGGPYQLPPLPPLPSVRISPVIPFVNIGVDCFGPLYVCPPNSTTPEKSYGVIFTCLVTRAIHLELAGDMSGDQFLQAFIRFASRRGTPNLVVSDNGRNFVFVQPLLGHKVELTDPRINEYVIQNRINWHYIVAFCPWEGGVYERMIGLVKNALLRVLGSSVVDYISLTTVLCQVEDLINSRPLTHSSSTEILQPLTPNSFLRPASNKPSEAIDVDPATLTSTASKLLKSYKVVRAFTEHFKSIFLSQYLQLMREKQVRMHPAPKGAVKFAPRIGEMVHVKEEKQSRARWPLGVIEKLDRRGAQAWVRIVDWAATYKRSAVEQEDDRSLYRTKLIQKSVKLLYPLELPYEEAGAVDGPSAKMARGEAETPSQ